MANYSIYSIPLYWVMAMWPHAYAVDLMKKANNKKWNNVNPHGTETIETYKKSVPADIFSRFEKAESAHRNMLENAPLFIGAVVVGNMVGLSSFFLNTSTAAYLVSRVVYIALYINVTRLKYSFFRTAAWAVGIAVLFGVLIKAGNMVAFEV